MGHPSGDVRAMWRSNLKRLVNERAQGNMKALSLKAGLGETAVRDILIERVKEPSIDTLGKIAEALNVPLVAMLGANAEATRPVRYVKVVGEVAAGAWRDVTHSVFSEYEIGIPVDPKYPLGSLFGLVVRGTSINRKAQDGDCVLCLKADAAPRPFQAGDWVVVEQIDGGRVETTVKQVKWKGGWELWADSTDEQWQKPIVLKNLPNGIEVNVSAFVLEFVTSATRF